MNLYFWQFLTFSLFKNWFLAIFEIAKNGIWLRKISIKLIYLISQVFFLAGTFLNILAHCVCRDDIPINKNGFIFSLQKSMTPASTHGALDVHQRNGITIWNRPLEDVCPSFTKLSAVPGSNTLYVSSINRLIHYIRFTYMYCTTYVHRFTFNISLN